MSNEENSMSVPVSQEETAVSEPETVVSEPETVAAEPETVEVDPAMESDETVVAIRHQNEAVAYLRNQDCAMLRILRDHLGENLRLHGILNEINAEIKRLNKLAKTPKPKLKIGLIILGILIGGGGLLVSLIGIIAFALPGQQDATIWTIPAILSVLIGIIPIIIAIVLKVVGNNKWKKKMEKIKAKLEVEKQKAEEAQKAIDEYWDNHALPYILTIIPDRFPQARVLEYYTVCGMLYFMENLQADTVKEAINLYDEYCFRANVSDAVNQMTSSMASMAHSAARAANAAERSAIANESAAASAASMALSASRAASAAERSASASERASYASMDASNAIRDMANRY